MSNLFRNRNFCLFWFGQSVSGLGTWINYVGLNAYIYHLYGSGKILGLFLLIRLVPALFFGSLGGILADRFDKRKIMIGCDAARALLVLAFLFTREQWHFFLAGFLLSALDKVFSAPMGAMVPEIVRKDDILEANSITRMATSVVTVVGPAVGGLLIGFWGYTVVFIIDSATFVFSVISLLLMAVASEKPAPPEGKAPSVAAELKETAAFLIGSSLLMNFFLLRLLDGLGSGTYNTALPVFASSVNSGSFYGYLIAFWGGGTFLGSMAAAKLRKKYQVPLVHLYCGAMVLMALGMGSSFHAWTPFMALPLITLGGIGDGISSVLFMTLLMELPPRHLRGKLFGTVNSILYVMVGLGMFLAGFSMDKIKYVHITDIGTALITAGTVLVWIIIAQKKGEKA